MISIFMICNYQNDEIVLVCFTACFTAFEQFSLICFLTHCYVEINQLIC